MVTIFPAPESSQLRECVLNLAIKVGNDMKFRHKMRYWVMRALIAMRLVDFEPDFYEQMNPDVVAARIDPLMHWVTRGRKEARLCSSKQMAPVRDIWQAGGVPMRPDKPSILLVSHEASRTGAPILCLSLARQLQNRFNVVTLLLRNGPLSQHFKNESVMLAVSKRGSGSDLRKLMWSLNAISFRVDAALVNSIVSYPVLAYLDHLKVPSLMLIHEYAAYCKPAYPFDHVVRFSGRVVFSATTTKSNAIEEVGSLPILTNALVLPQGQCVAEPEARHDADAAEEACRISRVFDQDEGGDSVVVVGAGSVNLRKGVDLFIQCAAMLKKRAPDMRFKFVWVGGGYDPNMDQNYSVYLHEQVKRSGLADCFAFLGEVAFIQTVYDRTDVFLLTSRLDPLPNVGIDAICNGIPIFCFRDASGIADILNVEGYGDELVAPHLDTEAMADLVLAHARSREARESLRKRLRETAQHVFSMERYAQILGDELDALVLQQT